MTTITYDTDLLPPPELKVPSLDQALAPESVKNDDPFLDLSYFPVPKGFDNVGSLELNNLSTAEDVATLQNQLNKLAEEKHKRSTETCSKYTHEYKIKNNDITGFKP